MADFQIIFKNFKLFYSSERLISENSKEGDKIMGKEIAEELKQIKASVEKLNVAFEQKISTDEWKNKKYDEMHELMLRYQDGIVEKTVDPLLKNLIILSDGIRKDIVLFEQNETGKEIVDYLHGLLNQIDAILFEYDVEMYIGPELFDPKVQRVSRTIPTTDAEGDKYVESVVSVGYRRNDSIFRIEKVNIYKYQKEVIDNE